MNKTPRTDYYWDKINKDNIDGFTLALKMRNHAYKLEEKMTDLMEWRIEVENELHKVTEQRDRLAEALKEYREALSDGPENCSYKMYEAVDEFAEQALQSLTTNASVEARDK
jgi:hypothetical protein